MSLSALPTVSAVTQAQGAGVLPDATEKTEKAARQFEGLLMNMLFQGMRKTIQPSGLFGDSGSSRSTYEYLMDQAVVDRAVSGGRGWGLAEKLQAAWTQAGTKATPAVSEAEPPAKPLGQEL
jgi:Rod binding domain-containing protein